MYDICLKYCYSKLLHLNSRFNMANFVRVPWLFNESQVDMHYIVSRALVGHNLGENAHKSSFLRGWDVMKDKI